MGAFRDDDSPYPQSAQYSAAKLYLMTRWGFGPVAWSMSFDGQYTRDELFSTEAFYIGGEASVRGFKQDGAQGDSGLAVRNDLSFDLQRLSGSGNRWLGAFTPGIFFDYGRVFPSAELALDRPALTERDVAVKTLAGAGVKLAFNYGIYEASATYARVLDREEWMDERGAFYFYAGIRGGF
jgi:hemolysin activation/secretion protein